MALHLSNSPLHFPTQYATLPVVTTNRCLQQNSLDQTKTWCQLLRSTGLSFSICTKTSLLLRSRAHSSWSKTMSTSNPNCGLVWPSEKVRSLEIGESAKFQKCSTIMHDDDIQQSASMLIASQRKLSIEKYCARQCRKIHKNLKTKQVWFGVCEFNRNSFKMALHLSNSPLHFPTQYATLPVVTTNRCLQQNSLDQTKICCQLLRSTGLSFSICTKTSLLLRSRAHSSWSKPMSTSNPNCGLV